MRQVVVAGLLLLCGACGASTNVVASGGVAIVAPSVAPRGTFLDAPTGRVDVAGAFVREGGIVRQYTANGWEVCPPARKLLVVQRLSGDGAGDGTAVVSDTTGDLVRLTPAYSAVVFTDASAPGSHVSVRAEGGDVTVFTSHR